MNARTVVILEGDETGQELLGEALRVLDARVIGLALDFPRYDLSLESRRATPRRADEGEGVRGATYTVSPIYEGMLKEEMDAAAERHPDVPYEPQLIDATFGPLIRAAADALVIPKRSRPGSGQPASADMPRRPSSPTR